MLIQILSSAKVPRGSVVKSLKDHILILEETITISVDHVKGRSISEPEDFEKKETPEFLGSLRAFEPLKDIASPPFVGGANRNDQVLVLSNHELNHQVLEKRK